MSSARWKMQAVSEDVERSILRLIDDGATMKSVSKCFPSVRTQVIRWVAKRAGRSIKTERPKDMVRVRAVAALVEMLGSQRKVAELLGCTDAAVSKDLVTHRTSYTGNGSHE